jgi:hypothetical protein
MTTPAGVSLPYPWPRRPPKDARCDTTIGSSIDSVGSPVLTRCPFPATETVWCPGAFGKELWVCELCASKMAAAGRVRRNPRKFPLVR